MSVMSTTRVQATSAIASAAPDNNNNHAAAV